MRRVVLGLFVVAACHANPSIDGSKVETIGTEAAPPNCGVLCDRFALLCGYAPEGCVDSCADFDVKHKVCIGHAPSCLAALQCENEPEPDAGEDDASIDAASE